MNRRERLRRCYFNEEIDRPAVFSRILFPPNDPTYDKLKAYLAEHSELKATWNVEDLLEQPPIDVTTEPYSQDFERRLEIWHTPKGNLRKSTLIGLKNQPSMHEERLLKTKEDAEKYLSLPMPKIIGDTDSFFKLDREMGDTGIVNIFLGINPGGEAARLFGTENFALMSALKRDVIYALCERQMKILLECVKHLLSKGIGPYFAMEGEELVAPPLHSPADFNDFNVKYDKPIIDLVHEGGGRMHQHCHGSVKKILPDFIEMGTDVLHPFEAPPMGDTTAKEAKEIVRGKICIEGNIQINRLYENTPDELREETARLIEDAFDDHKGLIVCPTASPYMPDAGETCFPQYKAMIDTVLEYKG
jgi:hypothetical protein